MKKTFKIIFPSIIMFLLIYLMRGGKDILSGIYFIFPIIYIVIGLFSDNIKELLISLILTSLLFIIPINYYFKMGSCFDCMIIYNILSLVSYIIKKYQKGVNI